MNNIIVDPKLVNCRPQTVMTTLNIVFSVNYYLELHNAIYFAVDVNFLPSKDDNVLYCPTNIFDRCWPKMRYTVNIYSIL